MGDVIYLKVSDDLYELPLAVANSPTELAKICNTTTNRINSAISHSIKKGKRSQYVKVVIPEEVKDL